jgi:tetratricopeptide (TPR) repeat protein
MRCSGFTLVFVALLGCLVALAYGNSMRVGFVFDDAYGLTQNPAIRSLVNIPLFFIDPFLLTTHRWNIDVRPVLQVTFALNYFISGLEPWSWRVFNLLVHLTTSVLVFFAVRDHVWWPREERGPSGRARWPAATAALIFALSPLSHQAVVYMWARSALLCACFYVGAFLAFLKRRTVLACALFLLALLTKTIAVTLPLAVLAYEFVEHGGVVREWVRGLRTNVRRLGALVAVLVAFLVYRAIVLPSWASQTRHEAWVTPWTYFMSEWTAYLYYVRLFLWPNALSADHDFAYNVSFLTARTLLSLAGVLVWTGVALRQVKRWPVFAFGTAWYFLTLATESTIAPISEVINDHRPYLATALGLALLVAWVIDAVARRLTTRPPLALGAATGALAIAGILVVRERNWVWQDNLRLWIDTAEKSPRNGRALTNAGQQLMAHGRLEEARGYFNRALAVWPYYSFLHLNLSVLATAEHKPDLAVKEAEEAARMTPDLPIVHQYLGDALIRAGRVAEGRAELDRANELARSQ